MIDEIAVALDLYKAAAGWVNSYWTFFSGVSLAVVSLVFGGKARIPGRGKLAIGLAYFLIAGANNFALGKALSVRVAAKQAVTAALDRTTETETVRPSASYRTLVRSLDAPPAARVQFWQALLSLMVLAGILAQHRHDRRVPADASDPSPAA